MALLEPGSLAGDASAEKKEKGATQSMMPIIQDTPPALVENGRTHSGFFKTPFRRVNLLDDAHLCPSPIRALRKLRLKEWVGFGINHPRLFGGIIIQDAKYLASGTVYLYDKQTGRQYEWLTMDRPARARLPETLWSSKSQCGRGSKRMLFEHDLAHNRHHIWVEHKGDRATPPIAVDLVLHQNWREVDPLVVSLPIAPAHHTYTTKSPCRTEGTIRIGDEEFAFDPARDLANLDEQKTFYPYYSRWLWGCFGTRTPQGREVTLNIVDQMTPKGEPGEDAMWVDGKLELLDQPEFIEQSPGGSWRIEDKQGRIKLTFTPRGSKKEKRNFLLVGMDYEQMYGSYDGRLIDDNGEIHQIEAAFGALERMKARF